MERSSINFLGKSIKKSGFKRCCWSLFFVLMLGTLYGQKALDRKIDFVMQEETLEEGLWRLSEVAQIPILFSKNLLPSTPSHSHHFQQISVKAILTRLLKNTPVTFTFSNQQILIIKKPRPLTISGYLEDKDTGERLIGANVFDLDSRKGTVTNEYGFFSLTLNQGFHQLQFSYLGYQAIVKDIDLGQNQQLSLQLSTSLHLQEVVVTDRDSLVQDQAYYQLSEEVPLQDIDHLPALGGEVDILRSLQQLPGVQSGTDGIGGLHVRGGNADQNLVLFDGVPVYSPYHTLGLYSIFDFNMIRKVRYFRGQFPARMGGRVSSVVDIRTREGNNKHFHAKGSIGLIASKLALEGPIVKNKGAFYITARRSHLDPFLKKYTKKERLEDGETGFLNYSFGEIIGKLNYTLNYKNHLYASFYKGTDHYYNENISEESLEISNRRFSEKQDLNWGNTLSVLRWNHQFSDKLFSNFTAIYSTFNFQSDAQVNDMIVEANIPINSFFLRSAYNSEIKNISTKVDFDFVPNPRHYIRFGINNTWHTFTPGAISTQNALFQDMPLLNGDNLRDKSIRAFETDVYAEDEWKITPQLLVNAGFYASLFSVQQKKYLVFEPRFSLHWKALKSLNIHLSASRTNQHLHLLTRSGSGFPTDLWVPSTAKVAPQQSVLFDGGVEWLINPQWSLAVNAYHKKMSNLISYTEGANFLPNSGVLDTRNWEEKITSGNGKSYGLEFLLKKEKGKTSGWIAYTLSKTTRQFNGINNNQPFPFRFDLRHVFNAVFAYRINDNWTISSNWNYSSGSNINVALYDFVYVNQSQIPVVTLTDYGSKNSFQLPANHRLDWALNYQKNRSWGKWSANIGVYNTYNQRNIFYIKTDYNPLTQKTVYNSVSLIPILPYFSLQIEL